MREVLRSSIAAILLLFSGLQIVAAQEELDSSAEVLGFFYQLFSDASFGKDSTEQAAWIVVINGEYFLQKWPRTVERSIQMWKSPLPRYAVAVAHTHPTGDIQNPSKNDIALAKTLHLPIYTICKAGIWKADTMGRVTKIKPLNWFKELKAKARAEAKQRKEENSGK